MMSLSISVDVPNLADGIRFYSRAFGFEVANTPVPGVAVLKAGSTSLCLLEKKAGTRPSPHTTETRRYERHWTPVHLDIHVGDLDAALARAVEAGARKEQVFRDSDHGSAAFCSDPFGHGFCLIQS
ncbi:MAG TPA: VOC family protein [Pseudolabrys sp.]|nr:VOC family protein [Pseudolabrys sp.]